MGNVIGLLLAIVANQDIQGIGLFIAGFAILYGARIRYAGNKTLTGEELEELTHKPYWISTNYPLLSALFSLAGIMCLILLPAWLINARSASLLALCGSYISSMGMFDGVFTLYTGLIPMSDRWHYRYINAPKALSRQIGLVQVASGFIVAVLSVIAAWKFAS